MLTRRRLISLAVFCSLASRPALSAPEGGPELARREKLAVELQQAVAAHDVSTEQAVEATIAAYVAGGDVTLCDVLLALDDELEAGLARIPRFRCVARYLRPIGTLPEPLATTRQRVAAAREKHLERCKQLEEQVLALRKAGQKSDAAAKRIKAYRQSAEIVVACRAMRSSPAAEIEAEMRDAPVKLLIERAASEREASEAMLDAFASTRDVSLGDVLLALSARHRAEMVLARSREDKLAAHQRHLARCKQLEGQILALGAARQIGEEATSRMLAYRQSAEINVTGATAYGSPEREAVKELLEQRLLARRAVEALGNALAADGNVPLADLLLAIRAQFEAETSSAQGYQSHRAAYENYVATAKRLEATIEALSKAGRRGPESALRAKTLRETAEMTLIEMYLNGPL